MYAGASIRGRTLVYKFLDSDYTICVERVIAIIPTASETSNIIEHLLLLIMAFKSNIALPVKQKALGGKYEHIKNIVPENSLIQDDSYLDRVKTRELFGQSAEKIAEFIIACVSASDEA